MDDTNTTGWQASEFDRHRARLRSVAARILGPGGDADDAVQEVWLRLDRVQRADVREPAAWLTTAVARIALDLLRARTRRPGAEPGRHERSDDAGDRAGIPERAGTVGGTSGRPTADPEEEAILADAVGAALVAVLDSLTPAERVAFVLHDSFDVPFDEIARVLGRSPDAAKQLASRARRKVQGGPAVAAADAERSRTLATAFLEASRNGSFDALVSMLHPDVVLEADAAGARMGAPAVVAGSSGVAGTFSGRALGAVAAMVDGAPGLVWFVDGRPKVAWDMTVDDGVVTHMSMIADPDTLGSLTIEVVTTS